jgi:large conductance mechanosensitive channel
MTQFTALAGAARLGAWFIPACIANHFEWSAPEDRHAMLKEFRDFALKGSVVDLAIGVVVGAAFGSIVTSLVNDIIMPPIGWLTGDIDFSKLAITLPPAPFVDPSEPPVGIAYGKFLNALISFALIAWALFFVVKAMNVLRKKQEQQEAAAPPVQEQLLTEIRDLLKK